MDLSIPLDAFGAVLQICLIDLLLSGDNAILIALACARLPPEVRRKAVFMGTGAAVLFRVILTFAATLALRAPYVKLVGALLLLLIAIELLAGGGDASRAKRPADAESDIWRAIVLIVVADAVMSLDNVVAVAAAAQDNLLYLVLGLLISVPILVFSSLIVTRILDAYPVVIEAGAALLGWIAGKTAVADPAVAAALNTQSFGLVAAAPVLGALYVLVQGRRLRRLRSAKAADAARFAPDSPPRAPAALPAAPAPTPTAPLAKAAAAAAPAAQAAQAASGALAAPDAPYATNASAARAAPAAPAAPSAPEPESADAAGTAGAAEPVPLRRFTPMDLTIMAGVAVPLVGLIGMIVYLIVHATMAH